MDILKQLGIEENNFGACAGPGHWNAHNSLVRVVLGSLRETIKESKTCFEAPLTS